jgi:hypothetical protein
MPWSGGVFMRSNGTYTGPTLWEQDESAGTGVTSVHQDVHDQDLADGVNNCLCKDGQNSPTADISWGSHKLTNLADGTGAQDAAAFHQIAAAVSALIPSGTVMSFFQASAPSGWTQNVTYNDAILRVVSGTGGGAKTNGGALSSLTVSGTVGGHSITQAELPNCNFTVTDPGHHHTYGVQFSTGPAAGSGGASPATVDTSTATTGISVSSGGSGTAHSHAFTGGAVNVNYVDMILASKN